MLKSLDILIGLSVVMLIVSMAVTLINQAILNTLAKRGRCLRDGIADLLQHLDRKMPRRTAEDVAAIVLTQPSVRKTKLGPILGALFPSLQFGEVIHREELTKTLLGFSPLKNEIDGDLKSLQAAIEEKKSKEEIAAQVAVLTASVQGITGNGGKLLQKIMKLLEKITRTGDQSMQKNALDKVNEQLFIFLAPLEKVVAALGNNGISDPGKILDNVQMKSLQMEKSNPDQASDVRHNSALLQEASSQFLAKINFVFDQIMDRVSERYTYNARIVSLFSAALVAIALQLDTVHLFNRLSMDDKMRDALVSQSAKLIADDAVKKAADATDSNQEKKNAAPSSAAVPATTAGAAVPKKVQQSPPTKTAQLGISQANDPQADAKTQAYLNFLAKEGVIRLPISYSNWENEWKNVNPAGIVLSILLLSMGAPFWYKAIGRLVQFRSLLAQKDDDQRSTRQTNQTPEATSKSGALPASP